MNKNIETNIINEKEKRQIFIFIVLFIISFITIFFLVTKNILILLSYFFFFNFCEIYYLTQKFDKKDLLYSLIKILIQTFIYILLFKILIISDFTSNALITFYILMILPIYFTSFVYINLKDKNIAIQDKIYKSIKDVYLYKKENIKLIILFVVFCIINKALSLDSKGTNLKLVNNLAIFSYIIITTITLYLIIKVSEKIKICKGENYHDAKS